MNSSIRIELELTPKEIDQLREVMDNQPLRPYAPLILKVLNALPFESDAARPSADSARPALSALEGLGRGFQLTARTPRVVPMVDAIDEVLRTLTPHSGRGDL